MVQRIHESVQPPCKQRIDGHQARDNGRRVDLLAEPPDDGKQVKYPAEEKDKEDGKDEGWRDDAGVGKDADQGVNPGVLVTGGEHSEANASDGRQEAGEEHKLQGRGEKLDDVAHHGTLRHQGKAEIAVERVPQPEEVLHRKGLVQVHLLAQPVHDPLGRHHAHGHARRVPGHDARDDEDHHGQPQENENRVGQAPSDEAQN